MQRGAGSQSAGSDKLTSRRRLLWVGSCEGKAPGKLAPLCPSFVLMVVLSRELSPRYWNATASSPKWVSECVSWASLSERLSRLSPRDHP